MSERFTRIYEGDENLYSEGAPVLIKAHVLLKDNETGNIIAQVKFQNIADKTLNYLKVRIKPYDSLKKEIGAEQDFEYLDLSAPRYEQFGQKKPIILETPSARSYDISVIGAAFEDGTAWEARPVVWTQNLQKSYETDTGIAYEKAVGIMNSAKSEAGYKLAQKEFEELSGYKDADTLAEQCRDKAEICRKEVVYTSAQTKMIKAAQVFKNAVFTEPEGLKAAENNYAEAIKLFGMIPGYKDADDKIQACRKKIEEIKAKAEADRLERERLEELERIETEKRNKRAKKSIIAVIIIAAAIIAAVLITALLIVPMIKYNNAVSMLESGDYFGADNEFVSLDGFGDSENKLILLNAIRSIQHGDYDNGIKTALRAGESVEVNYDLKDSKTVDGNSYRYTKPSDYSGLLSPEREGYRFKNWSLLKMEYNKEGILELTFNAEWDDGYTITYDLQGGTADNPGDYHKEGASFTLHNPKKQGYTFTGWTGTDLDVPTLSVTILEGSYGDREYTANWKANEYTLTLDPNGGIISETSLNVVYDAAFELPVPTKANYSFEGWFYKGSQVKSGTYIMAENLALTAKWTPVEYTITYNLSGGTNVSANVNKYTVESSTIMLGNPAKRGYNFAGWYSDAAFKNRVTMIAAGSSGNISLYAKWDIITYSISYDLNGGKMSGTKVTSFTVEDLPVTLPTATKSGLTFLNWNRDTYDGSPVSKITDIGSIKLVASYIDPGLQLILKGGVYVVSNYTGNASQLEIPGYYKGIPVKEIADNAFKRSYSDKSTVKTIVLPNTITSIGSGAFDGYNSLKNITLPKNLVSIGDYAFNGCTALTGIVLPNSVKTIGTWSFFQCKSLKSITFSSSMTSIPTLAFCYCNALTSVTIPSNIKTIGFNAFGDCASLKTVILEGVTAIETSVFENCGVLSSVTLPETLQSIGDNAFKDCKKLSKIIIPASVSKMSQAFYNCTIKVYCRAKMMPSGWDKNWNDAGWFGSCTVTWGYTGK